MSTLTSSEFSYVLGDLVIVQIRSKNEKGFSALSPTNMIGALVEVIPQAPVNPPRRGVKTNEVRLGVDWDFLTTYEMRGGTDIDSYELQIDDGLGGNFLEVVGFTSYYSLNSILISSNINSGFTYKLRYRAHNVHGWSDFSPEV
jgi:hypothetical protein